MGKRSRVKSQPGARGVARQSESARLPARRDRRSPLLRLAVDELEQLHADRVQVEARIRRTVALARQQGATWTAIARKLGVTPQAVQKRFGGLGAGPQ
jgi:hypothetical protein